jgi:hypothetical protein
LVEEDEAFEVVGHLLERLHGAQLGEVEVAPLQRRLALRHQGIDRTRIHALGLAGPRLPLEALLSLLLTLLLPGGGRPPLAWPFDLAV